METLNFCPFDLLFGRSVALPLSLLKSAWLQKTDFRGAKQNVVEYLFSAPVNDSAMLLTLPTSRRRRNAAERSWYDHRAWQRTFQPGNKVLALLPIPGNPLQVKFHGPYVIEQQLGSVDYVVSTPDRRKTNRVCYVNHIKRYCERDSRSVTCVTTQSVTVAPETVLDEAIASSTVSNAMLPPSPEEPTELKTNVTQLYDVSDKPIRTSLGVHHFELSRSTHSMSCAPCWLHPVRPPDCLCPVCLSAPQFVPWAPSWMVLSCPFVPGKNFTPPWGERHFPLFWPHAILLPTLGLSGHSLPCPSTPPLSLWSNHRNNSPSVKPPTPPPDHSAPHRIARCAATAAPLLVTALFYCMFVPLFIAIRAIRR